MKIETRDGSELLKLVGRRVLLKNKTTYDSGIFEAKVIEASPRGLVKLGYGLVHRWTDPNDYWLVEALNDPLPTLPSQFGNIAKAEAICKEWSKPH